MDSSTYIKIETIAPKTTTAPFNLPYYLVVLLPEACSFSINFISYNVPKNTLLFLAPYQLLQFDTLPNQAIKLLEFHGDFYCIEYHKEEVACNGILFNNVYSTPFVTVPESEFNEIASLFIKIENLQSATESYVVSVLKAYLQLILALSSKEKQEDALKTPLENKSDLADFKNFIELHFKQQKNMSFYAEHYGYSESNFSKKIKNLFGKPPKKLLQERLVLEAKKMLHLTYKNINQIALELGFEDEFYFSRFFKNEVGVSPKVFRDNVGIAKVAK
ncbi:AraC family transcriptional regulator [Flavobacterium agricola]|uniref:AraC family transcriptional regulator n=1 Tax=Flavobacterium agricola TaxID=2870839 RepID=A0ABY6M278_9FLAO|nr:AraC family transcriptional regulator [Flavobacterium agricola]UYW02551.1 AraC family transcriptional regulator [Flavobacterium agricola]